MAMNEQKRIARNAAAAKKLKEKIAKQLKRGAGKGVEAACRFLVARIKETLSVPAPRRALRGVPLPGKKLGPILKYISTARAVKGAPPRKLSGRLRQGVTHKMLSPILGMVGVHARSEPTKTRPEGFNYPNFHETGDEEGGELGDGAHPFILPTVKKYQREIRIIIGKEARTELMKKGGG